MSFYRHCCTQMKFIPLDTLLLQQEYLDHLNQGTYPDGSILFTLNPNVQPSTPTPTTMIPTSNLCADTDSDPNDSVSDCNSNPNVQPHHDAITNTHSDSENQPTQRSINIGNHVFTLPPIRTSMQPPTTLRQSAEQPENLLARSDLTRSDFSLIQKSQDHKLTPIVQRLQALIPSRTHCDSSSNSTTTTTSTTLTPIQQRNCAGDPTDCNNPCNRTVDSIDCAATSTTSTTITDASIGRTATFPTTQLQPRNCAGDPADCTGQHIRKLSIQQHQQLHQLRRIPVHRLRYPRSAPTFDAP